MPDDFQKFVHPEKAGAVTQIQQRCMNPVEAVSSCLKKYATFRGRATRAEYWWFWLFNVILNVILQALSEDMPGSQTVAAVTGIITLALFLPGVAACCRRLHDRDHTGWWQLIAFTLIGLIPPLQALPDGGQPLRRNSLCDSEEHAAGGCFELRRASER